jgi:hypothetical protein
MPFFNNKRKDFSIQPPKLQVNSIPFFVTDSANIDFTFANNNLTGDLTLTGVTAGTYGSNTQVPVLQIDQWGRITGVTLQTISTSGLALEVNGTPNGDQTLLNLVAGTNMTITDDGFGNITFDATGGGGTYTVDNGLTENPANNFQLGGTLVQNTTITHGIYNLLLTGTGTNVLRVISTTGQSVYAQTTSGYAVLGNATTSGYGGVFRSASGIALATQTDSAVLNAVVESLRVSRLTTGGSPVNGVGVSIGFHLEDDLNNSSIWESNFIKSLWTDVTHASRTSQFEIEGVNIGVTSRLLALTGPGQLILDKYGINTFAGTPAYALGVDATGNVVEFTASPTTGDSISPFLLMGG